MAYKTISSSGKAILLEKKGQTVEGYLLGVRTGIGKYKSTIYTFEGQEGQLKVWGNKAMDEVLLETLSKKLVLASVYRGVMTRVMCTDVRTEKKGKSTKTYRDHRVDVDLDKKLPVKNKTTA